MQVKDCVLRTRKGMVVSGIEALSVAMLLQMGRNVRRQVFNTAQEHQDRQSGLQPLLEVVSFCNFKCFLSGRMHNEPTITYGRLAP